MKTKKRIAGTKAHSQDGEAKYASDAEIEEEGSKGTHGGCLLCVVEGEMRC